MTTLPLHSKIQRQRLAQHALARLPGLFTRWLSASERTDGAVRDVEAVRALARAQAQTQPGFSADLFAAAARHEAEFGAGC